MFADEIEETYPECEGVIPEWFRDRGCFAIEGAAPGSISDTQPCGYFGGGDDAHCPCLGEGRQWAGIVWNLYDADAVDECGSAASGCEYLMPDEDPEPIDPENTACQDCIAECQGMSSCCTGSGCICQDECIPSMPDCSNTGLELYCDADGFCLCM